MKETVICSICGKRQKMDVYRERPERPCTIYPEFCPEFGHLMKYEIHGVLQTCSRCGYTFPRIDEDGIDLDQYQVESEEYRNPFGKGFYGPKEALDCYRVALAYHHSGCYRFAAQWYIRAAIMLRRNKKERERCFRNAWYMLVWEKKKRKSQWNFELVVAELNLKRLLGMFDQVIEEANRKKRCYGGIERLLIEKIGRLAERRNSNYMTYMEMLIEKEDSHDVRERELY